MVRMILGSFVLGWTTNNFIRIFKDESFYNRGTELTAYIIVALLLVVIFGYLFIYKGFKATRKNQYKKGEVIQKL
jgi:hypothetical protein